MRNTFFKLSITLSAYTVFTSCAMAAPIGGDIAIFAFWDNEGENTVGTGVGEHASFGVAFVEPDAIGGTTATASNDVVGMSFDPLPNGTSYGLPHQFATELPYASEYLTPWTITLTNEENTSVFTTPDHSDAEKMEFVTDLSITGPAANPTISWELPISGAEVHRIAYHLWDDENNTHIRKVNLEPGATSVTLNDLDFGKQYAIRITPENRDDYGLVSRSSNWVSWTATGGDVEGNAVVFTTGSPSGMTQEVSTPGSTFQIEFDYKFTTTTGFLDVFLFDTLVGTRLEAPVDLATGFYHAIFEIEDSTFFDQIGDLTFLLDGPTGSTIYIDNIIFPGLLNGTFEDGFGSWEHIGEGTYAVNAVPEPTTLLLLGTGLAGLAGVSRRKKK